MGKPFQSTLPARGATPCDRNSVTVSVFQSTLPARGATRRSMPQASRRRRFQSTLPARGATNIRLCYTADGSISIHAPCTGSDPFQQKSSVSFLSLFQSTLPARGATFFVQIAYNSIGNFNPRSLHGERHQPSKDTIAAMLISIHAPCTGSDAWCYTIVKGFSISIHAPCTGSDFDAAEQLAQLLHFNPRSLHGERRPESAGGCAFRNFNPRSLHGERQCRAGHSDYQFSHFNPRSLHGERRFSHAEFTIAVLISIHAPCTGSDSVNRCARFAARYFNPRSLHGERRVMQDSVAVRR